MKDFFDKLARILGVEEGTVQAASVLGDFEDWDSLGTLEIVSMIDADYGVMILSEEIAAVETARQLWELVQTKREST